MAVVIRYLAAALAILAAISGTAWYVTSLKAEVARLDRDLKAEQASRATERAALEGQARRAVETYRRQETETRETYEAINAGLRQARERADADRAAADQRRVRDVAAARAATAARGGRLPETAPNASGSVGTDPVGFLLAFRAADERDASLADDVARRLQACYDRARADRQMKE